MLVGSMISEEKEIDGLQVEVTKHPAVDGGKLFIELVKAFSPLLKDSSVAEVVSKVKTVEDLKSVKIQDLLPGLGTLFLSLHPDVFEHILVNLFKRTTVICPSEGKNGPQQIKVDLTNKNQINLVFTGKLWTMLKVAVFAIEVNFKNFTPGDGNG